MGFDTHMDCVFQVEWDKHCQSILRRHWPNVPKWHDVTKVNGARLPFCDVLIFGSPCQDLSIAGKQYGLDGDKSHLFFEGIRIIQEMRSATKNRFPRIAVWENVPGSLGSNKGSDFATVLDSMANIGAVAIEWAVLDAKWFGVPQQRRRLFVVASFDYRTIKRHSGPILSVATSSNGNFKKGSKKKLLHSSRSSEPIYSFDTQFGSNAKIFVDISPTLKASQQPPTIANSKVIRRLTPLECERAMGWPDNHTRWTDAGFEQKNSQRYKQCGNGVATPVAKWISKSIIKVLR